MLQTKAYPLDGFKILTMKKLIKIWLYPIITEIFIELLHKQVHNSTQYKIKDQEVKILHNNFFEEILKR